MTYTITFTPHDKPFPVGKLADAEIHFTDGLFEGLKLIGFAVWERRGGTGYNVTLPARQYKANGETRSFSLLRPLSDPNAQARLRDVIVEAWKAFAAGDPLTPGTKAHQDALQRDYASR